MPQVFKIGNYLVYFWINESKPLEPVHVHVSEGVPSENATKVWITKAGKCLLCHNHSRIPERKLWDILEILEANSQRIISKWISVFGDISYYC